MLFNQIYQGQIRLLSTNLHLDNIKNGVLLKLMLKKIVIGISKISVL
jgi:hypothetical protein